ncbi:MAG: hypothetical protein M1819_005771 [Sarea resinae]|nr:MAG: hypothetical protein M1819_005771 [Sarea resinae]
MATTEELAHEWLRVDKDETTRKEIQILLAAGNTAVLEERLRKRIAFGTAGLRARMEAGFSRLNSVTIIQASQGLAAYVLQQIPEAATRGIVIGYDGRHNSERFAKLAAAVFVAKGMKVWWYEETVHTPLVPFGVVRLSAAAGVMVTASHNPAQDNGYKVYWSNGCQIIPPHDVGIAASILQNLEPVSWDESVVDHNLLVEACLDTMSSAYYDHVNGAVQVSNAATSTVTSAANKWLKFVYTPMHGVGLPYMTEVVKRLGLEDSMIVVEEQAHPDPDFPTVKFPNPEEKGALDLAVATAERNGVSFVVASDPDADRLAVAEKVEGKWHIFTGNQLGVLLASYTLSILLPTYTADQIHVLTSAVSTSMLAAMGAKVGFHVHETLTGFKWLGNEALRLQEEHLSSHPTVSKEHEPDAVEKTGDKKGGKKGDTQGEIVVPFAFEEALGYMFPATGIYDKDSLSSAAFFLSALVYWRTHPVPHSLLRYISHPSSSSSQHGPTSPYGHLQSLYAKYGYFETQNTYLVSPDPETTTKVFESIRTLGGSSAAQASPPPLSPTSSRRRSILRLPHRTHSFPAATGAPPVLAPEGQTQPQPQPQTQSAVHNTYPTHLGHRPITRTRDLTHPFDSASPAPRFEPALPTDASTQMITWWLGPCPRSSGTGPGGEEGQGKAGKGDRVEGEGEGEVKFTARASGTEPKIKLYIESHASSAARARAAAASVLRDALREWFTPAVWGLKGAGA